MCVVMLCCFVVWLCDCVLFFCTAVVVMARHGRHVSTTSPHMIGVVAAAIAVAAAAAAAAATVVVVVFRSGSVWHAKLVRCVVGSGGVLYGL